jgi:hypothetical protein
MQFMQMNNQPKVWKALTLIGIVCDEEVKDDLNILKSHGKGKMVRISFIHRYKFQSDCFILGCQNFHRKKTR